MNLRRTSRPYYTRAMKWNSAPHSECQAKGRAAPQATRVPVRRRTAARGGDGAPSGALSRTVALAPVASFTLTHGVAKVMAATTAGRSRRGARARRSARPAEGATALVRTIVAFRARGRRGIARAASGPALVGRIRSGNLVEASVALLRVLEAQRFECGLPGLLCPRRPKRQQEVVVPTQKQLELHPGQERRAKELTCLLLAELLQREEMQRRALS